MPLGPISQVVEESGCAADVTGFEVLSLAGIQTLILKLRSGTRLDDPKLKDMIGRLSRVKGVERVTIEPMQNDL